MKSFDRLGAKRAVAVLAVPVAMLLGVGGVANAGAPAQEPGEITVTSCSHAHSNKDSGEGLVDADWLKRKTGPHYGCNAYGQEKRNTLIYYHCYDEGEGGTWTWGRVSGTNKQGWFKDSYLNDNGATKHC